MRAIDIPQISQMSNPEKILFVEELWDEISRNEEDFSVPKSHVQELDKRLENYHKSPGALLSFKELQCRIDKRK